jgi:hypothetical protein
MAATYKPAEGYERARKLLRAAKKQMLMLMETVEVQPIDKATIMADFEQVKGNLRDFMECYHPHALPQSKGGRR